MEPSPRDAPCRSPHRSGRFRRGRRILRVAWALARGNGGLVGLGLMYAVLATLLWIFVARADSVALRLLAFLPLSFASVLLAVALCLVAAEALSGRSCGIGEAVAAARARSRSVAALALVTGLFALALGLASRSGTLAGGVTVIALGLAWLWVTMFAAPEIALQGSGGLAAIRRSAMAFGRHWVEALVGGVAIGALTLLAAVPFTAVLERDPAVLLGLLAAFALGALVTLAQATWSTFAVVLQRDARGAVVAEAPRPAPPAPFWRDPLQRRAWIAWSTAILVVVVFVGGFVAARQAEDRRHKYDVEPPALASPNVLPFPLANRDQIHEGTGIYWFREAAGTVRDVWVRGDVLLVEVLLEPRFIPRAEAGGFQVNVEDGSSWISIIPIGLT